MFCLGSLDNSLARIGHIRRPRLIVLLADETSRRLMADDTIDHGGRACPITVVMAPDQRGGVSTSLLPPFDLAGEPTVNDRPIVTHQG